MQNARTLMRIMHSGRESARACVTDYGNISVNQNHLMILAVWTPAHIDHIVGPVFGGRWGVVALSGTFFVLMINQRLG